MPDYSHLCGHIYQPEHAEELQDTLIKAYGSLALESGAGKSRYLYRYARQVMGGDFQEIQKIGDCVPHGYQRGWIMLAGMRIALLGKSEQIISVPATESWYGWARVNIGKRQLGNSDGSCGSWSIDAARKYGILFRQPYGNIDLSTYDPQRARAWGYQGVPAALETPAEEHQLLGFYPAKTYEQARDLIYNGFAVMVCSDYGFENAKRDAQGFIRPRGNWGHCMVFSAVNDDPRRPGLLLDNRSWPNGWVTGPLVDDMPEGTGWVDAEYCHKMLSIQPDSYAMSDIEAFVSQAEQLDKLDMF